MAFFQKIVELIENIFSSNPELKNKLEFKKLENELKEVKPEVYKNSYATGLVGKAFFTLYQETQKIQNVLTKTICSDDVAIANYFSTLLIKTGYEGERLSKLNTLDYNNIRSIMSDPKTQKRAREIIQKNLEEAIQVFKYRSFKKIEHVLTRLDRLNEICNYKYIDVLHMFSPDFNPNLAEQNPVFQPVPINNLKDYFLDLLYLTKNYEITAGQGRAIGSLAQQLGGIYQDEREIQKLKSSLGIIAGVFNHILTTSNLELFIKLIQQDTNPTIKEAPFTSNKLTAFASRLERQVSANVNRIETELQDEKIEADTNQLFNEFPVLELKHYNSDNSNYFVSMSFPPFLWITPLKIVKSFMHHYYSERVQALLNDIVVEGFFNNPAYKTEFAQKVFACTESITKLTEFEESFGKGKEFDIAVMKSWARESSTNPELGKKLSLSLESCNAKANTILKEICTAFNDLNIILSSLLQDAHKVNAKDITNIKMLFNSSRNRDGVEILERQYEKWDFFIDIMKNYVLITKTADN